MGSLVLDLLKTVKSTFGIGRGTLDLSGLSAARTFVFPDTGGTIPLVDNPVFTGVIFFQQASPISKSAAATLTIAELLTCIIQYTGSAANLTLPTGTLTDAGILSGALAVNRAFEWTVVNTGAGIATLVAGTAHTIIGSAAIAAASSARFWTRKTATNTYVTYRV